MAPADSLARVHKHVIDRVAGGAVTVVQTSRVMARRDTKWFAVRADGLVAESGRKVHREEGAQNRARLWALRRLSYPTFRR